jgi:hypothetical protein
MARNKRIPLLLGLLGGSSAFSPLTIPGLALWLDASDSTTLFQADNGTTPAVADTDPVGYWLDKSGSGNTPVQASAPNKPTLKLSIQNGKNVVRFNSQYLVTSGVSSVPHRASFTIFLVSSKASTTGGRACAQGTWGYGSNTAAATNLGRFTTFTKKDYDFAAGWAATGVQYIHSMQFASDFSATLKINGGADDVVAGVSDALNSPGAFAVGGTNAGANLFIGDISEILIYNAALTAGQVSAVTSYLNGKWAAF